VNNDQEAFEPADEEHTDTFDELIMACDADSCLKILGKGASWKERKILGNVKVASPLSISVFIQTDKGNAIVSLGHYHHA
jgi:predicted NAD/FAD-binding protein